MHLVLLSVALYHELFKLSISLCYPVARTGVTEGSCQLLLSWLLPILCQDSSSAVVTQLAGLAIVAVENAPFIPDLHYPMFQLTPPCVIASHMPL